MMTEPRTETREEEVTRVRGYLAAQAMKRTPAQIVEALREAQRQFLEATAAVPEQAFRTVPRAGEWSAADVLQHMCRMAAGDERTIGGVLLRGAPAAPEPDTMTTAPEAVTRHAMLDALSAARDRLIATVLGADPTAHLNVTWAHREFGAMNWREWLLFARVHTVDHTGQMRAIATAVSAPA